MVECEAFLGGVKCVPKEKLVFRPSAYGIIVQDGKLLLMTNRRTGRYALPGGGIELGETIEDALKREVKEETGLAVEVQGLVDFRESFFYYDPQDVAFQAYSFFYWCKPITLDLIDDARVDDLEASNPRWIEVSSLAEENLQGVSEGFLSMLARSLVES